jgi:hypothetical protein
MKKIARFFLCSLLTLSLNFPVFAAGITDIPDNTLRVGNDFYDFTSANFTDANILNSLNAGNAAYVKLGGYWYNLLTLTDEQLTDPEFAEPQAEVNGWTNLGTWFQPGTETEEVTDSSSEGITGSYSITDNNAFTKKFSITLSGETEGFNYYNVLNDGTKLGNENVAIGESIVNVPQVFADTSKLTVEFYSDASGENLVATATLQGNVLNIDSDSISEAFKVVNIY